MRDFSTDNLGFLILVNECCLGAKVLMIIEILLKKWWKQKLGAKYD